MPTPPGSATRDNHEAPPSPLTLGYVGDPRPDKDDEADPTPGQPLVEHPEAARSSIPKSPNGTHELDVPQAPARPITPEAPRAPSTQIRDDPESPLPATPGKGIPEARFEVYRQRYSRRGYSAPSTPGRGLALADCFPLGQASVPEHEDIEDPDVLKLGIFPAGPEEDEQLQALREYPGMEGLLDEDDWIVAPVASQVDTCERRLPRALIQFIETHDQTNVRFLRHHGSNRFRTTITARRFISVSLRHPEINNGCEAPK